jgi:TonB family protein
MKLRFAASLLPLFVFTTLAASQAVPTRVRVSQDFAQGLIQNKVAPVYPPLARQARIQGTVALKVEITKSGDVEKAELISGHPMLAPSAIEAVKQWKYRPYLLNGEPVEVETKVVVIFTLSDKPAAEGVVGDVPGGFPPAKKEGMISSTSGDEGRSAVPQRVRVSQGVSQGLVVTKVPPQYPADAKDQRIQGVVVLKVNIDKEGNVYKVELISGHPLLAPPAIEAVKQWKYKPYLLNDAPVEVETQVTVNFTLAG